MADIRKRSGSKGVTYQVRYPSQATKSGYVYATFDTLKDARAYKENSASRSKHGPLSLEIRSVEQGMRKFLDICENEGCDGRDPITKGTVQNYEYRSEIVNKYTWPKLIHELTAPDIVEFRSWLLRNYSRAVAHKALTLFHSMVLELMRRGILAHDFAAGISVQTKSRYDEPVSIPTEKEIQQLLAAAERLANSKNLTIAYAWRRYRPMLNLAVDSGMRPQEYIVVGNSHFTAKGVQIERALERLGEISVPKTPAARRFIELSEGTTDMVRHYAKNHAAPNKFDLVFPSENGANLWRTPTKPLF